MHGIFISCVSKEFHGDTSRGAASWTGSYRDQLVKFLQECGHHVVYQENFAQGPGDILEKLDNYIANECKAVIHLIGSDAGWGPDDDLSEGSVDTSDAVHGLLKRHGKFFLADRPTLRQRLLQRSFQGISATQWEAYLAIHHKKPLFVFTFADEAQRAPTFRTQTPIHNDRLSQTEHFELMQLTNRDRTEGIANINELQKAAIAGLHRAGIFPTPPNPSRIVNAQSNSKRLNDRFILATNVELINGVPILRDEATSIIDTIVSNAAPGVLLVATAGCGKSCILAQVMEQLHDQAIPCLAIKLDTVPECNSSVKLGYELGLSESPVSTLADMAQGKTAVLIIDQLDSISTVSGRKTNTWLAFEEVRREVESIPSMKLIVACRDFDLQQDYRLRRLGDSKLGFKKVVVASLTMTQIRKSLDAAKLEHFVPTTEQSKILSLPFHLVLFLQGYPERPFHRIGDLYKNYWDRKQAELKSQYHVDSEWYEVIKSLCRCMSDNQATYAQKDVVDDWQRTAQHMVSIHVLVDTGDHYRFFHESFFDYAFARSFCRNSVTLHQFLTGPGEDQQLFRRAQVRQIMGYRRESRHEFYLQDLRELLASRQIRFHIKCMVASELHRIPDPSPNEWQIVEPYVLDTELSPAISNALRGHEGWFDLLLNVGVWSKWLSSGDAILVNAAIWFLSDIELQKLRSKEIAGILVPYANAGEDWDLRLKRIMSLGVVHHSLEMTQLYFSMIRRGGFDEIDKQHSGEDFWGIHHGAMKDHSRFFIDLVRCWLEHAVSKYDDGESYNFLQQSPLNHSVTGCQFLAEAIKHERVYYLEQIFPVFEKTILTTEFVNRDILLNRAWPHLDNIHGPQDMSDSILMSLVQCLEQLSKEDPARFREFTNHWRHHKHQTFSFLMLRGYEANPAEFANECVEFLCLHKSRMNVGYLIWSGEGDGKSAVSRDAIGAVTPHCSDELLRHLENAVIGYCDAYERQMPGRRGSVELLLLRSIDSRRRSQRANVRIKELECGFRNLRDERPPRNLPSIASFVGSPIPDTKAALMTDEQWIGAMTKYDANTDQFLGGHIELSHVLSDLTRRDRMRFAQLALKLPETVNSIYFSAILDGLGSHSANLTGDKRDADEKELSSFPIDLLERVIHRAHSLPKRPCGSSISQLVQQLADRELATATLDALAYYATDDPDPKGDTWKDKSPQNSSADPFHHGINTVRGRATLAIGSLLSTSQNYWKHFRPTIEAVISDPVISVRVCAVTSLIPVLNWDRDQAVQFFITCCNGIESIWGSPPLVQFVNSSIRTHYHKLRELLFNALVCSNENAVKSAASQIIRFDLGIASLSKDAEAVRNGNEWMRMATCREYARNIGHVEVGNKCAERIVQFFDDESDAVRAQIGIAFLKTDGERLLHREDLILRYIESKSFESDPEKLLRVLVNSRSELPNVIVRAAERIVTFIGAKGSNLKFREASAAQCIATLVVRQYAQTTDTTIKRQCLDLIDQMEILNYLGINEELEKLDR
jgi:hypothetical protein